MKILVYGAGVIGSFLCHVLCENGHDVTLLARGKRKELLDRRSGFASLFWWRSDNRLSNHNRCD